MVVVMIIVSMISYIRMCDSDNDCYFRNVIKIPL